MFVSILFICFVKEQTDHQSNQVVLLVGLSHTSLNVQIDQCLNILDIL